MGFTARIVAMALSFFCIEHSYSLQETDEELYRFGEETIC